jgi:uncharacterized surface protein with fasciclin (FAS1) repeats
MMNKKYRLYVALICLSTAVLSCKDNWEMHNETQNVDNATNLLEKLSAQANLSVFANFLKMSGYDQLLASSQNYTVWAPTNAALAGFDPTLAADPIKLKDFVANHIALTTVTTPKNASDTLRIKLLNNKFATIIGSKFEEANIVGNGQFVKNGVLQTIDLPVPTKLNVWEYMLANTDAPLQRDFIKNLSTTVIDSANAVIIGYNGSGEPIFAPNPPVVSRNTYWVNVADLRAENQQYTYFMLQDGAFTAQSDQLKPYYPSSVPNASASFYLVKDLTVRGIYALNQLPDTLVSVMGVKVPIQRSNIVKSYRASNGIVHVINALPFRLKDKVPAFKIEGEQPNGFSTTKTVLYRTKLDDKGIVFKDLEVYNHAYAEYSVFYYRFNLPVAKYKVYARAIAGLPGDSQTAAFTQRYFIYNTVSNAYTLFATHVVNPLTYTETYLGEYTPDQFGLLQLKLTAANSTSVNVNTLILDYLRFEPVLP